MKEMLAQVRPATVIELGAFTGGNAVWIADTLQLEGVVSNLYSMDINLELIEDRVKEIKPDNVNFIQGGAKQLANTFTDNFMKSLPHPLIVIDDVHISVFKVM